MSQENEKLMKQYGNITLIQDELKDKKINFITDRPFSDMPILRKFEIGNAYQIKETDSGVDVYYEPCQLYPGNRIIFVKDIPEKGIVKGDVGEIDRISSFNKLEITLDRIDEKGLKIFARGIETTDVVYDADYKFAYFAKVNTAERNYYNENSTTLSGFEKVSHFASSSNPIAYTIRYKGELTSEVATLMREQFEQDKPELIELEKKGSYSFLLMSYIPTEKDPTHMDSFVRTKICYSLRKAIDKKNKPKM